LKRPLALACLLGLSPLAHADPAAGQAKAQACAACHAPDGNPTNPELPILAAQTARYIYLQLKDYKEGRRKDPVMEPMAAPLSRQDMLDLGEYFAAQKPKPLAFKADPERVARGSRKAAETLCTMCHLGGFSGQNEIPRVAGQHPQYVIKELAAFKARTRTNDAGSMTAVARTLSEQDIEDLAHYIATLD
jgi:cytochrome c553